MTKQQRYRIVASTDGDFYVQERMPNGDWMVAHLCMARHEQGYKEARLYIDSQEEEGGDE